jgi:5-hydroxyisourate hydrolase-like protein (transthyretin family)
MGCSPPDNRKETFKITGEVYVDGQPANFLAVRAVATAGIDKSAPTYSAAFTNAEGKFTLSTYEEGDGIPAGQYSLTFTWGEMNLLTMSYGGADKLKGKYEDAAKSEFKVEVGPDKPLDLGRIELKTK